MKHVTPEFQGKLRQELARLDTYIDERRLIRGRFVLYVGVDMANAWHLAPSEFRAALEEWLAQGYVLDWVAQNDCLHMYAQEPDGPRPTWEQVFAEAPLVDVAAILREAGFRDAS
jgi:hypothetical protein